MATTKDNQEDLTGLRKQYTEALVRNQEAKSCYSGLLEQHRHTFLRTQSSTKAPFVTRNTHHRHLATHLQNLRLQQEYTSLQTITHYTSQAEQLANDYNLYDALPLSDDSRSISGPASDQQASDPSVDLAQQHLAVLLTHTKTLVENLELALVRARQDLKRERALLEIATVRAEQQKEVGVEIGGFAKLRALEAARAELQGWIAGSLGRCEEPVLGQDTKVDGLEELGVLNGQYRGGAKESVEDVERVYEGYIEARTRLLRAARLLKMLLPHVTTPTTNTDTSTPTRPKQEQSQPKKLRPTIDRSRSTPLPSQPCPHTQRPLHIRHRSRVSLTHTSKTASPVAAPSLGEIEFLHLPTYNHEKLLNMHLTDFQDQTHTQDAQLLQTLNLLSHESHLLPAHPLSAPDVEQQDASVKMSQQQSEVEGLLRAWAFVGREADQGLEENVGGMVEEAKRALERAGGRMEDLRVLEGMRREVVRENGEGR